MTALAFVDCETTGLDPERHEVWEVALILQGAGRDGAWEWQLPVDLGQADAMALTVGRFYERRVGWTIDGPSLVGPKEFASEFAQLTHGAHLVGAVPSFDAAFLSRLLRANGACPGWHYHLVDVEALAAGWLAGCRHDAAELGGEPAREHAANLAIAIPPWNSGELSRAVGVDPEDFDRHTAMGDARWAKAIYDRVVGP